jgi:acyl-CoA synthetase (AMP-forming)/AMP-acid ligase II
MSSGNVVEVFERRVSEFSNDIALVDGDDTMTYADLNARANQVARAIKAQSNSQGVVIFIVQSF